MKKIAIYFPGIGYHCDKPLLYYSRDIAYECGYEEYITLNYSYTGSNIKGKEDKMNDAFESLFQQAKEQLTKVDWKLYDDILFVSKSIGTIIACAYAKEHNLNCRHILYTPLSYTFQFQPTHGISFLGTKDTWSNGSEVQALSQKNGIPIHMIDGANHSLETDDCIKNIQILEDVMRKTKDFIFTI